MTPVSKSDHTYMPNMEELLNQILVEITKDRTKELMISKIDLDYAYCQVMLSDTSRESVFAITGGNFNGYSLQCICKLNCHRHFSVRVYPSIPQTCLKACKNGNLALILRNPRHKSRLFSESEDTKLRRGRFQLQRKLKQSTSKGNEFSARVSFSKISCPNFRKTLRKGLRMHVDATDSKKKILRK